MTVQAVMPRSAHLRLGPLLHLVWRNLWHERALTLCAVFTVAAAMAPLWMLWGLQQGIVNALLDRQSQDPAMRLILPRTSGGHMLDEAWFARASRWPGVAFVIPDVRSIAANVEVFAPDASAPLMLELQPTAMRDPMLGGAAPPRAQGLLLSAEAARQLRVQAGATIRVVLERVSNGETERAVIPLTVDKVLAPGLLGGQAAMGGSALLESIEAWRDGHQVVGYGTGSGKPPRPPATSWPRFRIYAADIRDVAPISERLEREGIAVDSDNAREIASTLSLQRNLRQLIGLVALVTIAGSMSALAALQVSSLRRKRREHALLMLTGHGRAWLVALPCAHALIVSLAGAVVAWLMYLAGAAVVAHQFDEQLPGGSSVARLYPLDIAVGAALAVLLSLLPAAWGGWHAANMEPADELRET